MERKKGVTVNEIENKEEIPDDGFDLDPMHETLEYELALTKAGFGKFNIHLLLYCGFIYGFSAIGLTLLSFILPAAVNEFNLTSTNKGILVAMPMIGMLFGSYFWGCLASTKGRWIAIFLSIVMDGLCGFISIFVPNLPSFAIMRFFNGFAIAGTMSICFPFLGEMQPVKYREKMLCWLEFFWVIGIIILPIVAYLIIPYDFDYITDGFVFTSWKLYLIVLSLPNFILAGWLFYFPESPKFLVEHDERARALAILSRIFSINSGLKKEEYGIREVRGISIVSIEKVHSELYVTVKKLRLYKSQELKLLIKAALRYTGRLFHKQFLKRTLLLFGIQFGLTCSYYTLMLWFPELFNRYKIYHKIKGYSNLNVCDICKGLAEMHDEVIEIQKEEPIVQDVYFKTLLLGLACLPLSVLFPFIVHRAGSRLLTAIGLGCSAASVFAILFAESEKINVGLCCIFESFASISISLLYGITVDLYPAKIRVIAAALGMSIGRCSALLGNLAFGYLIDRVCALPFIVFGAFLTISAVLTILLPSPDGGVHRTRSFLQHI